jgi:ADP-heptose:LPS heptosyltransferase
VVFGGPEDATVAESLVTQWGCGYVAAGKLGVREAIAAMERCAMYLGNDSGVMHLAVVAGLKCVAIFSARGYPGNWEPYGIGHVVFRKTLACAGCMLQVCTEKDMECIRSISEEDVFQACQRLFGRINH